MRPFGVEVSIVEPGSIATPIWAKGEADADDARAALGDEVNRVYGARLDSMQALAAETGAKGIPPERVAEAVGHALTARRPRTRYLVGLDAKIQARMGAVLPDRAFDSIVARMLRD